MFASFIAMVILFAVAMMVSSHRNRKNILARIIDRETRDKQWRKMMERYLRETNLRLH